MMSNLAVYDHDLKNDAIHYGFPSASIGGRKGAVNVGTTATFKRNETIFDDGDATTHAIRIINGVVRQCVYLPDGRRQIIDFFFAGDVLGLTDIATYNFCAEAVTDVTAIRYHKNLRHLETFDRERDQGAADNLQSQLCRARLHAVMLGRQTVKERIASFLIQIAERSKRKFDNGYLLNLPMSRQDVADYLGLTLETVCRTIGVLKRSRIIDVPNTHQIALNNIPLLRAVADGEA